jgi:prepilin-type N-terminal cleavage/methylation domain-containing protein
MKAALRSPVGFTLVEVILALTIFALMGTILYGAFSLGHRAVEKSHATFDKNQKLRSAGDILGSYIRSSYPYRASSQDRSVFYLGEESDLVFVSSFSLAMGGRGMAKIHLTWESDGPHEGILLLKEEIPLRLNEDTGSTGLVNSIALQHGVKEFRLAYLDSQSEEENWLERWDGQERKMLPRAVRLSYREASGQEIRRVFPVMMSVLAP